MIEIIFCLNCAPIMSKVDVCSGCAPTVSCWIANFSEMSLVSLYSTQSRRIFQGKSYNDSVTVSKNGIHAERCYFPIVAQLGLRFSVIHAVIDNWNFYENWLPRFFFWNLCSRFLSHPRCSALTYTTTTARHIRILSKIPYLLSVSNRLETLTEQTT